MDFLILDKYLLQRGGKETFHPTVQEKFRISFPREVEKTEGPREVPFSFCRPGVAACEHCFFPKVYSFYCYACTFQSLTLAITQNSFCARYLHMQPIYSELLEVLPPLLTQQCAYLFGDGNRPIQPYLILLHFTDNCVFSQTEGRGNPASSKSIGFIFPTAFACFLSLCTFW